MPELPELAAQAERLTASHAGAVLDRFEPLSFTALKTVDPPPDAAVGRTLEQVARRGKYLLLRFGDVAHVVHLMQGGRLAVDERAARRPKNGVARWHFTSHPSVIMTEGGSERRAGVWVLAGDPDDQPPLVGLGPEADTLGADELAERLAQRSMRLHGFLRDQSVVAGLGRRLANEICHRAGCSPFARTTDLVGEASRLIEAIRGCIADELVVERDQARMRRAAERQTRVHGRAGEPCPVCGDVVRAVDYRDYTVYYCATCQTGGKILADNTLSLLGEVALLGHLRQHRPTGGHHLPTLRVPLAVVRMHCHGRRGDLLAKPLLRGDVGRFELHGPFRRLGHVLGLAFLGQAVADRVERGDAAQLIVERLLRDAGLCDRLVERFLPAERHDELLAGLGDVVLGRFDAHVGGPVEDDARLDEHGERLGSEHREQLLALLALELGLELVVGGHGVVDPILDGLPGDLRPVHRGGGVVVKVGGRLAGIVERQLIGGLLSAVAVVACSEDQHEQREHTEQSGAHCGEPSVWVDVRPRP